MLFIDRSTTQGLNLIVPDPIPVPTLVDASVPLNSEWLSWTRRMRLCCKPLGNIHLKVMQSTMCSALRVLSIPIRWPVAQRSVELSVCRASVTRTQFLYRLPSAEQFREQPQKCEMRRCCDTLTARKYRAMKAVSRACATPFGELFSHDHGGRAKPTRRKASGASPPRLPWLSVRKEFNVCHPLYHIPYPSPDSRCQFWMAAVIQVRCNHKPCESQG
jgi:hypothetical protein